MSERSIAIAQKTTAPAVSPASRGVLQRACGCGQHAMGGECEGCKKKREGTVQRAPNGRTASSVPPVVFDALRSPGRSLGDRSREIFEKGFKHDFSRVRIHDDTKASESAAAMNALAYTVGADIVFASGRYAPHQVAGRRLLAHELAHVVQQGGPAPGNITDLHIDPSAQAEREAQSVAGDITANVTASATALQRAPIALQREQDVCSSKGVKCASSKEECDAPDPGDGGEGASTNWTLAVNIDIEASDFEAALRASPVRVGHTYVSFRENSGRQYTYGFYPAGAVPNENQRNVPGCVHHPDTTHQSCIDETVLYSLNQKQYDDALATAKKVCRDRHDYGQNYTCTTYADQVARAAGQSLPPSASKPTTVWMQPVPPIDNPNTLYENVKEERKKDQYNRFPHWNNPCYNKCEADFNACLKGGSSGGGLFGSGGASVMRPQQCMISRSRCYQQCPKP